MTTSSDSHLGVHNQPWARQSSASPALPAQPRFRGLLAQSQLAKCSDIGVRTRLGRNSAMHRRLATR